MGQGAGAGGIGEVAGMTSALGATQAVPTATSGIAGSAAANPNAAGGGAGIMGTLTQLLGDTPEEKEANLNAISKIAGGFGKIASAGDATMFQRAMTLNQNASVAGSGGGGAGGGMSVPDEFPPELAYQLIKGMKY